MHECILIVSYVPRGEGGFGGGVQFSKMLDFCCYQAHALDLEKPFLVSEKPRHLVRTAGEEDQHSCSSGLCTGINLISSRKSKPHMCIKSSKVLWPLSLSHRNRLVIFEQLIQ